MDTSNYYVNTIYKAAVNLGPIVIYVAVGYFIFIKLPFLLLLKEVRDSKNPNDGKSDSEKDLKLMDPQKTQQSKLKLVKNPEAQEARLGLDKKQDHQKTEQKAYAEKGRDSNFKDQSHHTHKNAGEGAKGPNQQQQGQKHSTKEEVKVKFSETISPETLFEIRPGQKFTKQELKQKYFELLKMNHPDKVASLGKDFKKLAEQNTKEINSAYDKLKAKAS